MELLKYSCIYEKKINGNPDLYIESFKKKIQSQLRIIEARSEILNNTIIFKRIVRNTTHSGMNKIEAMKILREGLIQIEKVAPNKIKISWEIKLDSLLFVTILVGLAVGLIARFSDSTIAISIVYGLIFSVAVYFVGYTFIKTKIDRIIESSI